LSESDIREFKEGISEDQAVDKNMAGALRRPYDQSYELERKNFTIGIV